MKAYTPLAIAALLSLLTGCGGSPEEYARLGLEAFHAGDSSRALDYLLIAERAGVTERDPALRYALAVTLLQNHQQDRALDLLESLVRIPSWRAKAMRQEVDILTAQGRLDLAERRLAQVMESHPGDLKLQEARGDVRRAFFERQWDEVKKLLARFLGDTAAKGRQSWLYPLLLDTPAAFDETFEKRFKRLHQIGFTEKRSLKEALLESRALLKQVMEDYQQVARSAPEAYRARLFLGSTFLNGGDFSRARPPLQKVILLSRALVPSPENTRALPQAKHEALALLMRGFKQTKQYEAGVSFLEKARPLLDKRFGLNTYLADFYYFTGRKQGLARTVDEILEKDARSPFGCFYKGYLLLDAKQPRQAVGYLERALAARPRSGLFNRYLGLALKQAGFLHRALTRLEQALESGPRDAATVIAYAQVMESLGEPKRASAFMGSALYRWFQRNPKAQRAIQRAHKAMLARAGVDLHDLQSARKAFSANRRNIYVALRLAELERRAGNYSEALSLVRQVSSRASTLEDAYLIGAESELDWGQMDKALSYLDRYEKVGHPTATSLWMRSEALRRLRRYGEAAAAVELVLKKRPGHILAWRTRVAIEADRKDYQRMETLALEGLKHQPEDETLLKDLVAARRKEKKLALMAKPLKLLQKKRPKDPQIALELGLALLKAGQRDVCIPILKQAALLAGGDQILALRAGRYLVAAGAEEDATPVMIKVCRNLPHGKSRNQALALLMSIQHRLGHHLEALEAGLDLRRSGGKKQALNAFLKLAFQVKAWPEAAETFGILKKENLTSPKSIPMGLEALLQTGRNQELLETLDNLHFKKLLGKQEALLFKVRALAGAGHIGQAAPLWREALSRARPAQRREFLRFWFAKLLDAREAKLILKQQGVARIQAPHLAEIPAVAAWAALSERHKDQARVLADAAVRLGIKTPQTRSLLIAVLAAAGDLKGARKLGKPGTAARSTLEGLLKGKPATGSFGRFLGSLRTRDFQQASLAAQEIQELPRTFRPALLALAANLARHPEGAGLVAHALGLALLSLDAHVPLDAALAGLRETESQEEAAAPFLRLFRAWILARSGSGKAAAGLIMPLIDQIQQRPLVALLAGLVVMVNTGPQELLPFVDQQISKSGLKDSLALDLARASVRMGAPVQALKLLQHSKAAGPENLALQASLLFDAQEYDQATKTALKLPPQKRREMPFRFLLARAGLAGRKTRAKSLDVIKNLVAHPELRQGLSALKMLPALADTKLTEPLRSLVEEVLATHPYRAAVLQQVLQAVQRFGRPVGLAARLRPLLGFVDPLGTLRDGSQGN